MPQVQSQQHQPIGNLPINEVFDSNPTCAVCHQHYDDNVVPHIIPKCGHDFCGDCIEGIRNTALNDGAGKFHCPSCTQECDIAQDFPKNWGLISTINGLRSRAFVASSASPIKRKRAAQPPAPAAAAPAKSCHHHPLVAAEVLCFNCTHLICFSCFFDCNVKQHKCIKINSDAVASAITTSAATIDAAFQEGSAKIASKLQQDIRQAQEAAQALQEKLSLSCTELKAREAEALKLEVESALAQADSRRLCQLLQCDQPDPQPACEPKFQVDLRDGDLVVRSRRSVTFPNGSVYEGFVDTRTGLADGAGCVKWGPGAGLSSGRSYNGLFSAGFTAERVSFHWKEQRPGQPHKGQHAYKGTVEVCSGAWTGHAFIQYDINEGGSYEGGVLDGRYHGKGREVGLLSVREGMWRHGQLVEEAVRRPQ